MDVRGFCWPMRHFGAVLLWDLRSAARRPATWSLFAVLCGLAAGSFAWLLALLARGGGLTLRLGDDPVVQFLGPNVFLVGTITLLVPLLTMNLVADEHRRGTWDVWWTSGLGRGEWLLARGTAAWLQLMFGLLPWLVYALTLRLWSGQTHWIGGVVPWFDVGGLSFDLGITAGGTLGLMLLGMTFVSMGLAVGALCRSAVAAACATLAVLIALLTASVALPVAERAGLDPRLLSLLEALACWQHHEAFSQGKFAPAIVAGHFGVSLLLWAFATWALEGWPLRQLRTLGACAVGGAAVLCLGIVLGQPQAIDLTGRRVHTLAPQTRNLLRSLSHPVEILIIAPAEARSAEEQRFVPAVPLVKRLAEQCREVSSRVTVRAVEPSSVESDASVTAPCVVVRDLTRPDRRAVLRVRDLVSYRLSGRSVEAVVFHGEQALAAALARLAAPQERRAIRFVTGRGELAPPDDRVELVSHDQSPMSLDEPLRISAFADRLRELGWQVESLRLEELPIPEDTAVLVIAGPREAWNSHQAERLRAWLQNGGRALVLAEALRDPVTGEHVPDPLASVLAGFEISLGPVEPARMAVRRSSDAHPLVQSLPESPVVLFAPRTLKRPLAMSGSNRKVVNLLNHEQVVFAAAVEQHGRPLLVVAGDSEFLTDDVVASAEGRAGFAFALSAVHWLQGRTELLGDIPPRVREPYRLAGTPEDHRSLVWTPLFVLLVLAATAATIAWNRTRNG